MRVTIRAPLAKDGEDMAEELRRIAKLLDQGFTSGEVHGGWWSLDGEPENNDLAYLKKITQEGYADFSGDDGAHDAIKRLEGLGYCRLVEREGDAWRVSQSTAQHAAALKVLQLMGLAT